MSTFHTRSRRLAALGGRRVSSLRCGPRRFDRQALDCPTHAAQNVGLLPSAHRHSTESVVRLNDLSRWLKELTSRLGDLWQRTQIQIDPIASLVAVCALIVAILAHRQSTRTNKRQRELQDKLGRIDHVRIAMPAWHHKNLRTGLQTTLGGTFKSRPEVADKVICSVYSGAADIEVESVYLRIESRFGYIRQRVFHIEVDINMGEGMAEKPPTLPVALPGHSRLDWVVTQLFFFYPFKRRGNEDWGTGKILQVDESLELEFGAYAKSSAQPGTQMVRAGNPLRLPWARHVYYSSVLEMLTSEDAPPILRTWFLSFIDSHHNIDQIRAEFYRTVDPNDYPEAIREKLVREIEAHKRGASRATKATDASRSARVKGSNTFRKAKPRKVAK